MTTTQAQPLSLDPATFATMLHSVVDALPHHPQARPEEIAAKREAAFLAISSLCPRDPLEAMLAARIIAAHYHAMHNLCCAAQTHLPQNLQFRYQALADTLSRLVDATTRELMQRQTAPARQPLGLPESVAPRPQPVPQQASTVATRPAQSDTYGHVPATPEQMAAEVEAQLAKFSSAGADDPEAKPRVH
jgi:hypothetical protein